MAANPELRPVPVVPLTETNTSAVSWPAIFVGAAAAAALSLVLVVLGFGLGLSSMSPWQGAGASERALGIGAIAWISFTQIAASATGGYLAGRLRVKWAGLHTDEVYFRDTAHGFMAWAVASLGTAAFLSAALTALVAIGPSKSLAADPGETVPNTIDSSVDRLLRRDGGEPMSIALRDEAKRAFAAGLHEGALRDDDRQYLTRAVAQQSGVTPPEATKRVDDRFNEMRATMDKDRKAAAHSSLWLFVALMLGAFCASLTATYGGRRRDEMV